MQISAVIVDEVPELCNAFRQNKWCSGKVCRLKSKNGLVITIKSIDDDCPLMTAEQYAEKVATNG